MILVGVKGAKPPFDALFFRLVGERHYRGTVDRRRPVGTASARPKPGQK